METSLQNTLLGIRQRGAYVLVVGMGISGVETAKFLLHIGIKPLCVERQSEAAFRQNSKFVAEADEIRAAGGRVEFGYDGEKIAPLLEKVQLAVLSPGVSLESAIVGTIQRCKVPWISELELGVQLHGGHSAVVTGSNGKSTTTTLLYEILKNSGNSVFLCGNVGVPVISSRELLSKDPLTDEKSSTTLVVEASSYQLEACEYLKPKVSIILNLSENHLERHGTMQRYGAAKFRVARLQDENDLTILNADDPLVSPTGSSLKSKRGYFTSGKISDIPLGAHVWAVVDHAAARIEIFDSKATFFIRTDASKLIGKHNRYNIAAAALAASYLGVDTSSIQDTVDTFIPLEHRVEPVANKKGVLLFNDSKSTTVAATVAAVTTLRDVYKDRRMALLIGGLSKAGSWEPLLKTIQQQVDGFYPIICFGKDGPLLASHCEAASIASVVAPNLQDAVQKAGSFTSSGDLVLLSPGCASFDEFKDFEHRGREFKTLSKAVFGEGRPMAGAA